MEVNPGIITDYPLSNDFDILVLNLAEDKLKVNPDDVLKSLFFEMIGDEEEYDYGLLLSSKAPYLDFEFKERTLFADKRIYEILEREIKTREHYAYFFIIDDNGESLIEIWDSDDLKRYEEALDEFYKSLPAFVANFEHVDDIGKARKSLHENIPDFSNRMKIELK